MATRKQSPAASKAWTGRAHGPLISIESITPGEYEDLRVNYSVAATPFGDAIIASTAKGVCALEFIVAGREEALGSLRSRFPAARFFQTTDAIQQNALLAFAPDRSGLSQIKLHLKGTAFQLKVWEALLKVPMGSVATYGGVAESVGSPKACRAVGTAVGSNPVAFLVPCHRVIRSTGEMGGYRWGADRKSAILGWEAAKTSM